MNCEWCGQDINPKAFNIHRRVCSKRPGVASHAQITTPVVNHVITTPKQVSTVGDVPTEIQGNGNKPASELPEASEHTPALVSHSPQTDSAPGRVHQGEVAHKVDGQPGAVSANGANEVFYPKADPNFIISSNVAEILRAVEAVSHIHPTNILITGQAGGGKTSLAIQYAAHYNRPIVVADFGVLQEPQQLFQTTRLINKDGAVVTDTRESGFIRGIETENCVVVMDELTRVENERVLNPLMPLLDGRGEAWIDELRRRVHVAKGVIFIATINEGALFAGITSLDIALRDRFVEVFMDYLPAKYEAEVLIAKTGVPKLIANTLAEFAYVVRTTPTVSKKVSTRQLLHAAELYSQGTALWQAVESAVGNFNDKSWRQEVMEIFDFNIKDPVESEKYHKKPLEPNYDKY